MKREHFLLTAIGSLVVFLGGGGYGLNTVGAKLDVQTREIVELRLSIAELKAARIETEKVSVKTEEALSRTSLTLNELTKLTATQTYQLQEHERRIVSLEGKK